MSISGIRSAVTRRHVYIGVSLAVGAMLTGHVLADEFNSQSGEQQDMKRVGHVDLQFRDAYQPNVIVYPNGKIIAFVGTHSGVRANPLKGGALEPNGTMIIDVTDPKRPKETFHIPVPVQGGQAQMARMCLGSELPGGVPGHVYLMRNIQGNAAQQSGYEIWDVTDIKKPLPVASLQGIRNTHKLWWECKSGLAYMPGSRDVPAPNRWRQGQSMVIYDWSHPPAAVGGGLAPVVPGYPKYIRTFGLVGAQPDGTGAVPPSLHGPISTFEHPQAGQPLARAAGPDDVIGNRIYLSYGVGDDGVHQTLDRKKLLPPAYGGTWVGNPDRPTVAELEAPQTTIFYMSPDQGGHTSFPVFGHEAGELCGLRRVQDTRHRAAGIRVDRQRVQRGAALELHARRHGGEFEDRAAGNAGPAESVARADGPLDHVGRSAQGGAISLVATTACEERGTAFIRARRTSAIRTTAG